MVDALLKVQEIGEKHRESLKLLEKLWHWSIIKAHGISQKDVQSFTRIQVPGCSGSGPTFMVARKGDRPIDPTTGKEIHRDKVLEEWRLVLKDGTKRVIQNPYNLPLTKAGAVQLYQLLRA
jgi:hypothetical protein